MQNIYCTQQGFSLFEVMVTLSIIGIMLSMILPIYSHHLVTARRMEAITALTTLSLAIEKYHIENHTYQGATLANLGMKEFFSQDYYQLIIHSAHHDDYLLMAKPLSKQAQEDTLCATLTLNAMGEKKITGSGKMTDCWY